MTPEGWRYAKLGELFELQLGKMLNAEATLKEPQFPYLGNREVQWGRLNLSNLRRMHFSEAERQKFSLRPGDLLVCEGGEVGRTALWREQTFDCYFQKAIHRLRPAIASIVPEFILQFMQFAATSGRLNDFTSQSSIAHLTREKLAEVEAPVPPLPEQRKIAAILSSVDHAIESTQAVIEQLSVVKKAMMAELLTRGLPGRHTRFKQTEIGEIPEEWEVGPLSAIVNSASSITYGIVQAGPHVEGGVPYIRTGDVKRGRVVPVGQLARTTPGIAAKYERSRVVRGDLVFCIRASVGAVAVVSEEIDGANLTQGTARISPGPSTTTQYLLWALRSANVQNWVALQSKGSTFREITLGRLRDTPIPLPSLAEQDAIAASLDSLDKREQSESEALATLAELKRALLAKLLSGELRVRPGPAVA